MEVMVMNVFASFGAIYWGYFQCHYNVTQDVYTIMMGIKPEDQAFFNGIVTGIIQFGAIIGALMSSQLVSRLSRRKAFMLIDSIALLGTAVHCVKVVPLLLIGNLLGGMSTGLNSTFIGTYVSEVSPKEVSGIMGSILQYLITIGMIITSGLGLLMPTTSQYIEGGQKNLMWLLIFAVPAVFPMIRLIWFIFVQKLDTPYYYSTINDQDKVKEALVQIYKTEHVEDMREEINEFNSGKQIEMSVKDIWNDSLQRHKTLLGIGLAFVMQVSGINGVLFYSNVIFKGGNNTMHAQQIAQILTLTNICGLLFANIFAGAIVDRLGRKQILCWGQVALSLVLWTFVVCLYFQIHWPQPYIVIIFTIIFGLSQGPVIWLYLPEILNGKPISIASSCLMVFATVVGTVTPMAFDSVLQQYGTFAIFALGTTIFIPWEFYYLVESKNRSRREINDQFIARLGLSSSKIERLIVTVKQ